MNYYCIHSAVLISFVAIVGCGSAGTAPPIGLKKPPAKDFAALEAEKFIIEELTATVTLPKDNPKKRELTGTREDSEFKRTLPRLKCRIELDIRPKEEKGDSITVGIRIDVPLKGKRLAHASGSGRVKRSENGKLVGDFELVQTNPIALQDDAMLYVRVLRHFPPATSPVRVDSGIGRVIIIEEP